MDMIIVDCSEVLPIKHSLMIYVADRIEAIPVSKQTEFVISPIENHKEFKEWQVILAIEEYLKEIGEKNNFSVISKVSKILIKSINGRKINRKTPNVPTVNTRRYHWEQSYN